MRWGRRLGGYIGPLAEFLFATAWYIMLIAILWIYRRPR